MTERPAFGKIEFTGKGKLTITSGGSTTIIHEDADPRRIVDNGKPGNKKDFIIPEGSLESLRPLLRGVSGMDISDNAEGYWAQIDSMATMSPEDAVNKFKRAGVSHIEAARLLVMSDPLANIGLSYNNFSQEQIDAKISEVAALLLPFYSNKRHH